jgi:hypothetical protein
MNVVISITDIEYWNPEFMSPPSTMVVNGIDFKLNGDIPTGASITVQALTLNEGWQTISPYTGHYADLFSDSARQGMLGIRLTISGIPGYKIVYQIHDQQNGWGQEIRQTVNGTPIENAAIAGNGVSIDGINIGILPQ